MNGSTVHKRCITLNFPLTTHFSANSETWTLLKRTIQIIKYYLAADWRLKEHYPKWNFPNDRLQENKTTNIYLIYGVMRICAHLKIFYACTTTKTLSQHSKECKESLLFITRKELTCWSSGVHFRIWRIFVSTNLPIPTSIHLLSPIKTCCKRFEKIWLVDLLSSSHVKLWSTKLLSGIQEIFVSLLLALTEVSCILILCASPCQQDYTRDGNMTQNLIDLNLNRTNPETLRTWLCHISGDKDPTVKLRVSTPQELRKRLIVSR